VPKGAFVKFEEIVMRLNAWATRQRLLTAQYKALQALTNADCECALLRPVWDVWSAYTMAVSELVGDTNEWLQWYELECDMGRKPKEVTSLGGKTVKVKTIRQLARVIAY
jgi:hypothetical protein